ncbi:MAG: NAD(+) synthase [Treponema sp.]|nr:NAD(+) synthase [Treponema sp.]
MNYGFLRVAASSVECTIACCTSNANRIIEEVKELSKKNVSLVVFPELCITGATCSDLFFQSNLQKSAILETQRVADGCKNFPILIAIGLPFAFNGKLFNCIAFLFMGQILALVPKSNIESSVSSYDSRWFSNFSELEEVYFSDKSTSVPFGKNILICDKKYPNLKIAAEIGSDAFLPFSPALYHSVNGATVIVNSSSTNETVEKREKRKSFLESTSKRICASYIYSDSSETESTTDAIFASHKIILENGKVLCEGSLFEKKSIIADIDIDLITNKRILSSFNVNNAKCENQNYKKIYIDLYDKNLFNKKNQSAMLYRTVEKNPFIPESIERLERNCENILSLQSHALAKRLKHIATKKVVLGLSGGLDSTLALLACVKAFDLCDLPRENIISITMPCFGTTDRTYNNALSLAKETGSTLKEINISESVRLHFKDIGQDETNHDTVFENAQARERTQILMDIANKENALVIGTGDLSELALGWCTYNGDHMSMYAVNSSIPKTLIRHIVFWEAKNTQNKNLSTVLKNILETPVSPELLPPKDGNISQETENIVGPYDLHDFYLYHMLVHAFSPEKILFLADNSNIPFSHEEKLRWLKVFYKRFFSQQFKRSCMPDGAKVTSLSLSPRSNLKMPSDAASTIWLKDLEGLE